MNRMKSFWRKLLSVAIGIMVPMTGHAQLFPLSENDWDNPEFVERYLGSYGMDMELSPEVSMYGSAILRDLLPFIEDDVEAGIFFLEPKLRVEDAPVLDYMLAQLYLENRQPDEAIKHYNTAIRKFPNFLRAYKNIAIAYMQMDDCEGARPHLDKVLELARGDGLIYGILGYCHLQNENYSSSMSAYEIARLFEPDRVNWQIGLAQASLQARKHQDAIVLLEELIRENPANATYLMLQTNAYLAIGEDEDAISNLEILNRIGEATGMSLTLLGDLYIRNDILSLALRSYMAGLDKDDRPVFSRASRAVGYFAQTERWQNAQSYLERLKSVYGNDLNDRDQIIMLISEAEIAQGMEQFSNAVTLLEQAIGRDPLNGKALLLMAQNHKNSGDYERAELFYDRAAAIEEVAYDALTDNARMAVSFRRLSRALSLLERANLIRPSSTIESNIRILRNALNEGGT